jgi:regulator of protease activity HflC (stomatin/prohibitin superfamily)
VTGVTSLVRHAWTDSRLTGRRTRERAMVVLVDLLIALAALGAVVGGSGVRVIKQYERGLVFRWGKVHHRPRGAGLAYVVPFADRMRKVNMQIVTMPVPAQDGITRDNVSVRVDAVVYFNVIDPVLAVVNVQDYRFAVAQVAQTSLRSIIGKSELDELLSNREKLNEGLELMIDSPALDWGIHIDRVEIKDVALPETMKRSMSRQAEAERERRARVISADGELQASYKLAQAAATMADHPAALQLRLLETVVQVAAEKNSTLVLPFPVELLRFLEHHTGPAQEQARKPAPTDPAAPVAPTEPVAAASPEVPLPPVPPTPEIPAQDRTALLGTAGSTQQAPTANGSSSTGDAGHADSARSS